MGCHLRAACSRRPLCRGRGSGAEGRGLGGGGQGFLGSPAPRPSTAHRSPEGRSPAPREAQASASLRKLCGSPCPRGRAFPLGFIPHLIGTSSEGQGVNQIKSLQRSPAAPAWGRRAAGTPRPWASPARTRQAPQNATWRELVSILVPFLNDTSDYLPVGDKDMAQIISLHILVKKKKKKSS